jgi:hypothetical protein
LRVGEKQWGNGLFLQKSTRVDLRIQKRVVTGIATVSNWAATVATEQTAGITRASTAFPVMARRGIFSPFIRP